MRAWVLAVALVICAARAAWALDVPPLEGRVNDRASVMSAEERTVLDGRLRAFEEKSGRQFAVLTIPTLAGDDLEGFSIRVVEEWKLGRKGQDNGLLLLVVSADRKVRIEVGYGLEGQITDALSSRVIREVIAPEFRKNRYGPGIAQAMDALMRAAAGETALPELKESAGRSSIAATLPILFFFIPIFVLVALSALIRAVSRGGRRGIGTAAAFWAATSGWSSGGGGDGGGFSGGGGDFGGGGASGGW
jgi:uncharacterized protein